MLGLTNGQALANSRDPSLICPMKWNLYVTGIRLFSCLKLDTAQLEACSLLCDLISSFIIVAFVGSQRCWLWSLLVPSMLAGKSQDDHVVGASCLPMHALLRHNEGWVQNLPSCCSGGGSSL